MSRGLLGATLYVENLLPTSSTWTLEEQKNVEKYLENWKNFKFLDHHQKRRRGGKIEEKGEEPVKKKPKLFTEQLDDEIDTSVRLLVEFAGFQDIDESALEKLKNVWHRRFVTIARQFSAAERRRKDGLEMPYKSPVEWTLKLNGVQKVIEIKRWYDVTYWMRYRRLKEEEEKKDDVITNK